MNLREIIQPRAFFYRKHHTITLVTSKINGKKFACDALVYVQFNDNFRSNRICQNETQTSHQQKLFENLNWRCPYRKTVCKV